jgi:hypothetical protein
MGMEMSTEILLVSMLVSVMVKIDPLHIVSVWVQGTETRVVEWVRETTPSKPDMSNEANRKKKGEVVLNELTITR